MTVIYSGFAFESVQFPGAFLRMDGTGVTGMTPSGSGKVNCQGFAGKLERFQLIQNPDGTTAINSIAFPKVFLRMDCSGVTKLTVTGGGVVNAQGGVGTLERFRINIQPNFQLTIESAQFPGVFLRMDGNGVKGSAPGSGKVNCQFGAQSWEQFLLRAP
ncbi:MAG: hypothetical protein V4574_16440 [Pseudomonadota bacterium]